MTVGTADLLIAGIALANGLTLVTNNQKHYELISELLTSNWNIKTDHNSRYSCLCQPASSLLLYYPIANLRLLPTVGRSSRRCELVAQPLLTSKAVLSFSSSPKAEELGRIGSARQALPFSWQTRITLAQTKRWAR